MKKTKINKKEAGVGPFLKTHLLGGFVAVNIAHRPKPRSTACRPPTLLQSFDYRTVRGSVTRLGDLLHSGQLFKAFGNN